MKKFFFIFLIFFFIFNTNVIAKIAYLDVNYILENSQIGKFYQNKISIVGTEKNKIITIKEKIIKEKQQEINNQKNLIKKSDLDKKIQSLNVLFKEYQKEKAEINQNILKQKKEYTKIILDQLNPILTKYVEENAIDIVLEKKNILIGKKILDITNDIIKILDNKSKQLIKNE
tara:strand:+ start:108 stop:626 length:519 start_codon:yes stop_codon:yes gene_type:complete